MSKSPNYLRGRKIVGWSIVALFLAGLFYSPVGVWTGPILSLWFIAAVRPVRGFVWLTGFTLALTTLAHLRGFPGWIPLVASALVTVAPFVWSRILANLIPGFASTLVLPTAGALVETAAREWLPGRIYHLSSIASHAGVPEWTGQLAAVAGPGAVAFLVYWFAAVVVWAWDLDFRAERVRRGLTVFGIILMLAGAFGFWRQSTGLTPPSDPPAGLPFAYACLLATAGLSVYGLISQRRRLRRWGDRPEAVALLRSPATGDALAVASEPGRETLVSRSGERFPIRDGIPALLKPEQLTGLNRKYNHLYEIIGGFYDDVQRVACALTGIDRDAYVSSYLAFLEVKPGDAVLETSVGTGLNFKYLPRGVALTGIDLSAGMLLRCQANLLRWRLDADLFLCNAETLPFADSSFDVVFHVGGINFFNDRNSAIREMIRVAKPGTRILIADETEEHVKENYERTLGGYFKNRTAPVAAPVDLVPPEMEEVQLTILNVIGKNRFYALTFRKPTA